MGLSIENGSLFVIKTGTCYKYLKYFFGRNSGKIVVSPTRKMRPPQTAFWSASQIAAAEFDHDVWKTDQNWFKIQPAS